MFLLGVEFVFVSYAGTRIYQKAFGKKTDPGVATNGDSDSGTYREKTPPDSVMEDKANREKNLRYLKASGVTLGFSHERRLIVLFVVFVPDPAPPSVPPDS